MKIKATIEMKTAIELGIAEAGEQVVEMTAADLATLTLGEREVLAGLMDGDLMRDGGDEAGSYYNRPARLRTPGAVGVIEYVRVLIDRQTRKSEEKEEARIIREARAAEEIAAGKINSERESIAYLADPAARLRGDGRFAGAYYVYVPAEILAENKRRVAIDDAIAAAAKQEKEAIAAAKETAKTSYISDWISTYEPENVAQWAEGLLCRDQAIERIADQALDAYGPLRQKRTMNDLPDPADCESCSDFHPIWSSTENPCVEPAIYARYCALRERVQAVGGVATLMRSDGFIRCNDSDHADGETESVYFVRTQIPVGPFRFKRDIAL